MIREALETAVNRKGLSTQQAREVMLEIMDGSASHSQIAAFITAMRMKGETEEELTGFALTMRERAARITAPANAIDLCGTGGDGRRTLNISTMASFVVAAAGVPVAKHGNRAVSSASGSADLLRALGVPYDLDPVAVQECMGSTGFGFMFAPVFHQSMRNVMMPRREIGIRTFFNMLGPMTNPAGVKSQLIGVYDPDIAPRMAQALRALGTSRALLVHSEGTDEVTNLGDTRITELSGQGIRQYSVSPTTFGIDLCEPSELAGGSPNENARAMLSILKGETSPRADAVAMNAGAALYVAGIAADLQEGIDKARETIMSGRGRTKLIEHHEVAAAKEQERQLLEDVNALRGRRLLPETLRNRSSEVSADLERTLSGTDEGLTILDDLDRDLLAEPSVLTVLGLRRAMDVLSEDPASVVEGARSPHSLSQAISDADGIAIIAEYKPSSPSDMSLIDPHDPEFVADAYTGEGASAVSVLAEREFFSGGARLFSDFRSMVSVPMIYKDFVVSPKQIEWAGRLGADAVLLISKMLNKGALARYVDHAISQSMEPLVEIHDRQDLQKLADSGVSGKVKLVGVNSRDLRTLSTDLTKAVEIGETIPQGVLVIAESGVSSPDDLTKLKGFDAALIGSMFMRSNDLRSAVRETVAVARSVTK